ncbi:MAG: HAD-IIB family hydrolase [candidate division Zixibacteria bacterium]|nr:HAD-IIB family hydrolase [candidate division Zixibacteria bacterium]
MKKTDYIIFTDLDGTLLDAENYSASAAFDALQFIRENRIPLVFVTSKTAMEIQRYRKILKNTHPFICENGGGIYIPRGYFDGTIQEDKFDIIGLGAEYSMLKIELKSAAAKLKIELTGISDMTDNEIMKFTGIQKEEVPLARQRGFDEPFVIKSGDPNTDAEKLEQYFSDKGLIITRGNRFFHLMGNSDKGMAIEHLLSRYIGAFGDNLTSIGFGDSPNDLSMFKAVDIPVVVKKPPSPGHYDPQLRNFPGVVLSDGIGPAGWNKSALQIVKQKTNITQ